MKQIFLLVLCFFLLPVFCAGAQESSGVNPAGANPADASSSAAPPAADASAPADTSAPAGDAAAAGVDNGAAGSETAEQSNADSGYIDMDIKTSTLMELAAWCRELGLSDGGAKDDLASRLRTYYKLPPGTPAPAGQRVITIESAKSTEYFTLEAVNEDYARLKGNVIISLKDGNAVHRIKAWEILYNRTRNVLTASGDVEYVKQDGDTVETFKGDSITVNLDNWSSIFTDGVSEKSIAGNSTAYRFAGTVISRNSEEVTVLSGADITNPANSEAYWSLHASKLWLLPGNDWAILNAVLKVGNIPVLYVPGFYYPSDEIVFHPVLGYRSREGTFLQTTTYILGRPKTDAVAENSITKIFGSSSSNMEKKREGVFLRTTGQKSTSPNDVRLSMLFDAYVNLGVYLGTELALPRKGNFGETTISAGMGLTRDIFPLGNANTPFATYDGTSQWNSSKFFSAGVPFRYRFNMTGSYSFKYGSLSLTLPYYSDPYTERDFMRRSEVLDWLSMLREGAAAAPEDPTELQSYELSSYNWILSGSFNPQLTSLAPYISSLAITSVSSSLTFNTRDSTKYTKAPTDINAQPNPLSPPNPGKSFFFPSTFNLYTISASMSGTPFSWGSTQTSQTSTTTGPAPGDALLPDAPIPPWDTTQTNDQTQDAAAKAAQDTFNLSPPVLSQTFALSAPGNPPVSLGYSLTPTTASQLQFRSTKWAEQGDIDWSEVTSILSSFRSDASVTLGIGQSWSGPYSESITLRGSGTWQDYMYLNKDAEDFTTGGVTDDTKVKAARNRAYSQTGFTSSWNSTTTLKPFYQNAVWGSSSLQYTLQGLLAKTNVDTTGDKPDWTWVYGKWDKTNIDTNQIVANVNANIMDNNQSLSITAVLPPKDSSVSANATFNAWISTTSLRGQVTNPLDESSRVFQPVYLNETLKFSTWGNFQQNVVFDPKQKEYTSFTSSLNLSGFTAAFSAVYARPYRFNPLYGVTGAGSQQLWIQSDQNGQPFANNLEPQQLQLGYTQTFAQKDLWQKRLSFSVNLNSSLTFDLQRYTNSRLSFTLGATMSVSNFLDLNLSTRSENAVVYRYFQKMPFFDTPPTDLYQGYENNFFVDLLNSFRFDNNDLRRQSGFKLKSLSMSMVHHLGDWNASLTMNMTPYLPSGSRSYQFSNDISFLVQWVPIGEIKTQVDYLQQNLTIK